MIKVKTLRPFNSAVEFVSHCQKDVIWLKSTDSNMRSMVTDINFTSDEVYLSGSGRWYSMENLMYDFVFPDDEPCGIYEWREEK